MKKIIYILLFFFFALGLQAQQSVQYSQFMMNRYGLNPAVAGYTKDWNIMVGRRTQWRGFAYAPETNFASITKDLGKKGYKRYWHGVGLYVESDKFGAFINKSAYGTYAIHLKLSRDYYLSFGLNVGIKQVTVNNILFDANDPALAVKDQKVLLYPDFIPGLYFYSRKIAVDVSVRNLYKNTLAQGGKKIGTPTKLIPSAFITLSRKFYSPNYDFTYIPAIHVQSTFTNLPLVHFNCMAYYRKRVGFGLTYRMHDAVSAILQVRLFDNLVIGFAYDYTVSRFRAAQSNSTEIMMGFTPVMSTDDYQNKNSVAECPKFEF